MALGKFLGKGELDRIRQVLDLVWDNRDDLARSLSVARNLPNLISSLAEGLGEAGVQAKAASRALVGTDGTSGATSTLSRSAGSVGAISARLASVAQFISEASDDVEKVPLMSGPATKLGGAARTIESTTTDLGELAEDLVGLSEILATVGAALGRLGESLDQSGNQAQGFLSTV